MPRASPLPLTCPLHWHWSARRPSAQLQDRRSGACWHARNCDRALAHWHDRCSRADVVQDGHDGGGGYAYACKARSLPWWPSCPGDGRSSKSLEADVGERNGVMVYGFIQESGEVSRAASGVRGNTRQDGRRVPSQSNRSQLTVIRVRLLLPS